MAEQEDSAIVDAVRGGDRAAFHVLVERYERPLYNAAYRITGNSEDAMDATQSAFLKAFAKLEGFDRQRAFFSWLYRIAVNESLELSRRRSRRSEVSDQVVLADSSPGPERDCAATETLDSIQRALSALPPDQRVVVVLRHLHGHTYDSISEITGVPTKTVKSRLFSARRSLREVLTRQGVAP